MSRHRIILVAWILSLLPTAIDPSCAGYFVYAQSSPEAAATVGGGADAVADAERPAEGLAATRIPAPVSVNPLDVLALVAALSEERRASITPCSTAEPDFLSDALRRTYLRNAELLI